MNKRHLRIVVTSAILTLPLAAIGVAPAIAAGAPTTPARANASPHVAPAEVLPDPRGVSVTPPSPAPASTTAPTLAPVASPTAIPVVSPALTASTVAVGPSQWTGPGLRHPNGRRFSPSVLQWANLTLAVMTRHGIPDIYLPGILAQIQQESGGDPAATNLWDSNALRGTPSKGLLQVIAPTYTAYAMPRFRSLAYQTVPFTNIWAALNYAKKTYGMKKFDSWAAGKNTGY